MTNTQRARLRDIKSRVLYAPTCVSRYPELKLDYLCPVCGAQSDYSQYIEACNTVVCSDKCKLELESA